MTLRVLNVAYPLSPVGPDAVGGAEQILSALDVALASAGHESLVVACEGSKVAGRLLPITRYRGALSAAVRLRAQRECRQAIRDALERYALDLIHLHGIDFPSYLPPPGPPTLVTLHLPLDWYPSEAFALARPHTLLQCVSRSQALACPGAGIDCVIENGVDVDVPPTRVETKSNYVVALGRICPEKGFHLAIDAARRAGVPLLLAGQVFGYPEHQAYYEEAIRPRLDSLRRFIGPVGKGRREKLLRAARCVLIPSQVRETSSLVAMEALACGTPVVAYANGSLAEVIEPERTGYLVGTVEEMAAAIERCAGLDPAQCQRAARQRFSRPRMVQQYLDLYQRLAKTAQLSLGQP